MFKPSKIFLFSAAISTRLCERQPLAASVAWRVAISGIASSPAAPRKDGVGVIASRTKQSPPVIASRRRSNLCLLFVAIIISFFVSATANIASAKTINLGSLLFYKQS